MTSPNATASGQFTLSDRPVTRLGFGAMQLTGEASGESLSEPKTIAV